MCLMDRAIDMPDCHSEGTFPASEKFKRLDTHQYLSVIIIIFRPYTGGYKFADTKQKLLLFTRLTESSSSVVLRFAFRDGFKNKISDSTTERKNLILGHFFHIWKFNSQTSHDLDRYIQVLAFSEKLWPCFEIMVLNKQGAIISVTFNRLILSPAQIV